MNCTEHDLVRLAKREHNPKRNYLVVNPLQGKHIPVRPSEALELFSGLADTVRNAYPGERLLLIGFAETATAIGAHAAISLGTDYIHTTREKLPNADYLFFSEEHSHAAEQKLVKDDLAAAVSRTDRIVFIEDEVTTGKTILNITSILKQLYPGRLAFSVASLLNGMPEEALRLYESQDIRLHYLVKTDHSTYSAQAELFAGNGHYYPCMAKPVREIPVLKIPGKMDTRRLVNAAAYEHACERLWKDFHQAIGSISDEKILITGTEEFMYPALFVGKKLEECRNTVFCHSTTRSPVTVSLEKEYPLHERYELKSLYERERRTFLYEIGSYDRVFVVTDAPEHENEGLHTLVNALGSRNDRITLVRWC